jgi:hypothetical protein
MTTYTTRYRLVDKNDRNQPALFARPKRKDSKYIVFEEPKSITEPRVYRLNGKRLAAEVRDAAIDIRGANIVLVKSPKGTGKTRFLREYLKTVPKYRRILAVVHRRTLAKTLSNELDLSSYLEEGNFQRGYVISIDSLTRFNMGMDKPYDVLVLDEVEQVFRHLISDTTERKRGKIFKVLTSLIDNAKQIICSDADLTISLTGYLLEKLRSNFNEDKIVSIVNEWKSGRAIEVYESKQHLTADLICDLADGKRIYIPVGELSLVDRLVALLRLIRNPDGSPISVLALTGKTSEDRKSQDFFDDPNAETPKYQVIIATSTLSTGVSIDVDWFDAVYGIFDSSVYTFQDCDQAISRVRNCGTVRVWIHQGPKPSYPSESAIRSGPVKKEMVTRGHTIPDGSGKLSASEELYMDVESRIRWCEQNWKSDRTQKFINLKVDEGWSVTRISTDPEQAKAGSEMLAIGKDPSGNAYHKAILLAENLTPEQFDELKAHRNLRGRDGLAVSKYWIANFFELPSPMDVTMAQIKAYDEKDLRRIVKHAKLMTVSRAEAIDQDRGEREYVKNTKAFTSFDHRTETRDILTEVQHVSGIRFSEVFTKAKLHVENEKSFAHAKQIHQPNSRQYREASKQRNQQRQKLKWFVTQDKIDNLANYVDSNLGHINLFFGTNFKTPTAPETKTKVFNAIMGQLGVEIRKKAKPKGEKGHDYLVDYDRVAELVDTKDISKFLEL